jgi:hypothetical protein
LSVVHVFSSSLGNVTRGDFGSEVTTFALSCFFFTMRHSARFFL